MDGTINFMVAKIVKVGQQRISIVGGVRYWADSPDTGPHGFGGGLGMTFLFPARLSRLATAADSPPRRSPRFPDVAIFLYQGRIQLRTT